MNGLCTGEILIGSSMSIARGWNAHVSSSLVLLWMGTVYHLCDVKGKHKVPTTSLKMIYGITTRLADMKALADSITVLVAQGKVGAVRYSSL